MSDISDIASEVQDPSADDGDVQRVILIERCSGVQVGRENDQISVYEVTLPELELTSADELAEALLDLDSPWASDLFSHDAPRLRFSGSSGERSSGTHRITAEAEGDTMVLIRDSIGVEIGDHNVQRNQFRIRGASVEVEADELGLTTDRAELVAELHADPTNRSAARKLAENVAESAAIDLEVTLALEIADTIGSPQIEGWPDAVRDRTGVQIGEDSEATAEVEVRVLKWKAAILDLTRQILDAAAALEPPLSPELGAIDRSPLPDASMELDAEAEIEPPELSL